MKTEQDEFDFFVIDENRLHKEWLKQPRLFFDYAAKKADAQQDLERAKSEMDVVAAELDQEIRVNYEKHGFESKPTEPAIKAWIRTQEGYSKCQKRIDRLKHESDIYSAAVSALDHRKKALENLVSLRLANYYAEPQLPKGSKDEPPSFTGKKRRA